MAEQKISPKLKPHYVSNADLYKAYVDWYSNIITAKQNGTEEPGIPKFIAESIMKICTRLAYRPNFINYSFREEMIGDALENTIRTAKNFNPERSNNPFSFITTIAFNAFLRRIKTEQKETYIKSKIIEEIPIEELMDVQDHDEDTMQSHNQFVNFLRDNNYIVAPPNSQKKKSKALQEEIGLEEFFEQLKEEELAENVEC